MATQADDPGDDDKDRSDFPIFSSSSSEDEDCDDVETKLMKMMDLTSKTYNPLLALTCKDVKVPGRENVVTYPCVKEFKKHIPDLAKPRKKRGGGGSKASSSPVKLPAAALAEKQSKLTQQGNTGEGPQSTSSDQPHYPIPGRRFLPHQLPVHRPRKEQPNVLTLMNSFEEPRNPLGALNRARLSRNVIKVWTKNGHGVRGFCTGHLEAFDKHWNLVLSNVTEKFQRKRHFKTPVTQPLGAGDQTFCQAGQSSTTFPGRRLDSRKDSKKDRDINVNTIEKGIRTMRLADDFGSGTVQMFQQGLSNFIPRNREIDDKNLSKSLLRRKRFVLLNEPIIDFHGNKIVARSQEYEIVLRQVPQLFLFADSVVFIETGNSQSYS